MLPLFSFKDLLKLFFIISLAINNFPQLQTPLFHYFKKYWQAVAELLLSNFLEYCTSQQSFTKSKISLKFNIPIK